MSTSAAPVPMKHVCMRLVTAMLALLLIGCSGEMSAAVTQRAPTAPPTPIPTKIPTSIPTKIPTSIPTTIPTSSPSPVSVPTADVFAAVFPLGDVAYVLPPTIRHVTPTSAVLFFELDRPVAGALLYRAEGGPEGGEMALSSDTARQQLVLEDLSPGRTYRIRVGVLTADNQFTEPSFLGGRWGDLEVHTPDRTDVLRFGVIGDASFGDPVTAALVEQMAAADLDFVLHTGDVVDETEPNADPFDSYAHKYYEMFAALLQQMPVYTVPGNHDYDADIRWGGEPFYYYAFPPFEDPLIPGTGSSQYYAFSAAGLQFVMLDSQVFFGIAGREEQRLWLTERLADGRFQATIPVFHVSPFSSSSVHREEGIPIRQSWAPLFEAANVPLVFSGHTHQYERLQVAAVTYIVSGGGSGITYAPGELLPESQVFARKSHFILVEVYPDRLDLTSLSVEGEPIDQVSISLP